MILTEDKKIFLEKCFGILAKHGVKTDDIIILGNENIKCSVYTDDLIYIASSDNGKFLEVLRKNGNYPIIYIENGSVILFSRDYIYLLDHIEKLL